MLEIQDAVQRCRDQLNERDDDDPVVRDELAAEDAYHDDSPAAGEEDAGNASAVPKVTDLGAAAAGPGVATRFPRRKASRNVTGVRMSLHGVTSVTGGVM